MIVCCAGASRRAAAAADGVSVVKAHKALAIRSMKRQRITDAMRALIRRIDAFRDEFHPVSAERIDDEHDAIKRKEIVKHSVMFWFHHWSSVIIR
jgi:hypothetical protein